MKALRPIWIALRAALLATAVFWMLRFMVDKIGWQAPLGLTEQLVFFVVFFFGVLMIK